jgi:hypothetical protein
MIRSRVFITTLLIAAGAHAEPTAIEKSTADALFKEGKALMEKKQFDAACPKLAESYRLQPGGGAAMALAICHEGQGKLASALNDYREALALALRDKRKDREDAARAKMAEIEPRTSRIVIHAKDVSITIDGVALPAASLGSSIPIDGGTHTIEATAPERLPRKVEVTIAAEKDRKEVEIAPLEPLPKKPDEKKVVATPPPPPPPKPVETRSGSAVPYVIGGLGVIALGVGGYFGVTAISKRKDVSDHCPGDVCTDPAMVDRNNEAKRAATISNIAIGVGVLAIGTAVVLLVVDRGDKKVAIGPGSITMQVAW